MVCRAGVGGVSVVVCAGGVLETSENWEAMGSVLVVLRLRRRASGVDGVDGAGEGRLWVRLKGLTALVEVVCGRWSG